MLEPLIDLIVEQLKQCNDEDLLDLILKLLIAENEE